MEFNYSEKAKAMRPSIIRELLKQMGDPSLISFAGGNPAADAFPAQEIRRISDELLAKEPVSTLQYNISEGYPPLRKTGQDYLNRHFAVKKDVDELMVTSGSQQVMDFAVRLLCNEGDYVTTEDPAFLGALNAFRSFGVNLVGVELEDDGVNLAALEAVLSGPNKPKLYYTIPNFQNPTGVTTSLEKRKAVYALCKKHGVPILEDNPYGELRIAGQDLPPIKAFDEEGLVIYAASLSKIFAPGLRVAFCVAHRDLVAKMTVVKQCNDVHTNVWGQRICERYMASCDMDAHIARLREIYAAKAATMIDQLDQKLKGRVEYTRPEGGMFIWLTLPAGVDMPAFVQKCLDKKLAVVPGNAFYVDAEAPCQGVRINFSMPTAAQIVQGVAIMDEVLSAMGV